MRFGFFQIQRIAYQHIPNLLFLTFRFVLVSDILLVAGDMGHNIPQVSALFDMLKHDYKNILFCLGNHEYWYYTGRVKYKNWNDKVNELKSTLCGEQVKFMDGNIFDYNGIAIGGSSMWYDFSSAVSRDVPQ